MPLFILRMRSQFLRPFSRIINENLYLRIMHVFLRLQPWILDFAKILRQAEVLARDLATYVYATSGAYKGKERSTPV